MSWIAYTGIVVGVFALMEGVTWATHKYVMHGFLWYLHEDHHKKGPGFFEKNDAFFVIFAIPSFLCILVGTLKADLLAAGDWIRYHGLRIRLFSGTRYYHTPAL